MYALAEGKLLVYWCVRVPTFEATSPLHSPGSCHRCEMYREVIEVVHRRCTKTSFPKHVIIMLGHRGSAIE